MVPRDFDAEAARWGAALQVREAARRAAHASLDALRAPVGARRVAARDARRAGRALRAAVAAGEAADRALRSAR